MAAASGDAGGREPWPLLATVRTPPAAEAVHGADWGILGSANLRGGAALASRAAACGEGAGAPPTIPALPPARHFGPAAPTRRSTTEFPENGRFKGAASAPGEASTAAVGAFAPTSPRERRRPPTADAAASPSPGSIHIDFAPPARGPLGSWCAGPSPAAWTAALTPTTRTRNVLATPAAAMASSTKSGPPRRQCAATPPSVLPPATPDPAADSSRRQSGSWGPTASLEGGDGAARAAGGARASSAPAASTLLRRAPPPSPAPGLGSWADRIFVHPTRGAAAASRPPPAPSPASAPRASPAAPAAGPSWDAAFVRRWIRVKALAELQARGVVVGSPRGGGGGGAAGAPRADVSLLVDDPAAAAGPAAPTRALHHDPSLATLLLDDGEVA